MEFSVLCVQSGKYNEKTNTFSAGYKKKDNLSAVFISGTLSGARTLDPLIKSQLLYQLS